MFSSGPGDGWWGDVFLAYLLSPGVDVDDPVIVEHASDCSAGRYPDHPAPMDAEMKSLGWSEALADSASSGTTPRPGSGSAGT